MNILALFFSPDARVSRIPFFLAHVLLAAYTSTFFFPFQFLNEAAEEIEITLAEVGVLYLVLLMVALLIYMHFCLAIKRFRDTGHSTAWTTLMCVPLLNVLVFFYLLFAPPKSTSA